MKKWILPVAALALCSQSLAVNYFNDFESAVGAEWSNTTTSSFNGTTILGRFSNDTVTLTLNGLTAGEVVNVGFHAYILDSWDGNQSGVGPDRYTFKIDGADKLDTTFSNVNGYMQSYPDPYLGGSHARYTGADDTDQGTLPAGYYGNSLYIFGGANNPSFTGVATGSSMTFTWVGSNLQGVGDESWGLDNVWVKTESVPEPATMTVLALGGLAALRRRKA
ncbi:MAG: PEP-CTERM sorting domain-containing protein [Fimbriimonadaceae bacterium]|nr:PEP-CTERM sorting domain-containing protein [Fimbriimonadaceae bacterium]